ncbi:MAG TPA: methyltransferase domain-containing protein [Ktedonobacteraceae bacterium]|jgi:23S rRNA G2445 N2-methylase RlmL|nr:methyltransferase domain-containing protein [Ktedonobacteraceae bacterium]
MAQLFYAMTMPGLETLAFSEMRAKIADVEQVKFARGIVLFRTSAHPSELLDIRTTEDIYFTLAHIKGLGHGQDALRVLHSATLHADLETGLATWRRARGGTIPRTWRVVSQKTGSHDFRRMDAGKAVHDALRSALPRKMHAVDDDADLEVWLWLSGSEAFVGIRLSDATMRHRQYKLEHLPASLRPTVAAAMGWVSQPTGEDTILDPLCGAGTLVIERALLAPYSKLIGGDIRKEAVAMAQRNARAADVGARWHTWNARALPLDANSVTRILTNLPFGKQIGAGEDLDKLYHALIEEFGRVLTDDGLMVTLTSEDRLLAQVLREQNWHVVKKMVLVVLGLPASIFVAQRG